MDTATETINAHPYTATCGLGIISLWHDEELILTLPSDFPVEMVRWVAQAYANGEAAGRHSGAVDKAFEIRRALML